MAQFAPRFFTGQRAICLMLPEVHDYPVLGEMPAPPIFATSGNVNTNAIIGYYDPPETTSDEGTKIGFSGATPFGVYQLPGYRQVSLTCNLKLAGDLNLLLLSQMVPDTGPTATSASIGTLDYSVAYGGLIDVALVAGMYGTNGFFYTTTLRYCKLVSCTLSFEQSQDRQARELVAQCTFMGLYQEATSDTDPISAFLGALTAPNYGDISSQTFACPLSWFNIISVNFASNDYGPTMRRINMSINHNVTFAGSRNDTGDNDYLYLSRAHRGPLVGSQVISGDIEFFGNPPQVFFDSSPDSTYWQPLVITANGDSAAGAVATGGSTQVVVTLNGAGPDMSRFGASDVNSAVMATVPFVAADLTIEPAFSAP